MIADRKKFEKIKNFNMKKGFAEKENFLSYIDIWKNSSLIV